MAHSNPQFDGDVNAALKILDHLVRMEPLLNGKRRNCFNEDLLYLKGRIEKDRKDGVEGNIPFLSSMSEEFKVERLYANFAFNRGMDPFDYMEDCKLMFKYKFVETLWALASFWLLALMLQ